jgi:hypothetical protein
VHDDRDTPEEDRRAPADRLLARGLEDSEAVGRPLSDRARHTQRSVEAYLKAGVRPRWMERIVEVDRRIASEKGRIERAYRALQEECARDPELFAGRWRALAESYRFDALNELIRQHNDWYPIERDLPMDPRTRDYVPIHGRSYRRRQLGPEWVLEHFPPVPPPGG